MDTNTQTLLDRIDQLPPEKAREIVKDLATIFFLEDGEFDIDKELPGADTISEVTQLFVSSGLLNGLDPSIPE